MKAKFYLFLLATAFSTWACNDGYPPDLVPSDVLIIPSSFSPNGDGVEDVFLVSTQVPLSNYYLIISNDDPSTELFTSNNLAIGWDGIYDGIRMPPGPYTYTIRYSTDTSGHFQNASGYLQLIR